MRGDQKPLTDAEATAVLTSCHPLLARIDASGQGIFYHPRADDLPLIEGLMRVCHQWSGYEHEGALDQIRGRSGLSPSGWGLVCGMVQRYALSLPGVAERRLQQLREQVGDREEGV